jgi:hypothetical protein
MKINWFALFLLLLVFLCSPILAKKNSKEKIPSIFQAIPIDRSVQLSGKLDDPLWLKAIPVLLAYEFDPGDNTAAPQRTQALALFDQEYLYLGFRCFDTRPQEIRANLSDRDKIFQDDYIIASIDTYNDFQRAYAFAVNPYGIQADLMTTINSEDSNFDLFWLSAAAKNDSGWTAEMAIPFKSLRFPNKDEQTWRIHLLRNYPRSSRVKISWMPIDRNIPSFLSQGGLLQGMHGIKPSGSWEVLPYIMGQQGSALRTPRDVGSGMQTSKLDGRIGSGFQYSLGPNLSVEAVINPDFSQIESDADQISVNTTFALDYPEKRPFFLIGQELLETPMYYSRSINDPSVAGRIVGKSGPLSYLVQSAYDRNTTFIIPGEDESDTVPSTINSYATIGRLRQDFGNENYLGGMLFTRDLANAHNYLTGVDWSYKFHPNWYFSGETFVSHTKELNDSSLFQSKRMFGSSGHTAELDGEQYYGDGFHAVLSYNSRSYDFGVVYNDFSPTYQTYNGYFPSVDYRQCYMEHEYKIYPQKSFLDKVIFSLESNYQFNHQHIKKEQFLMPGVSLRSKGQTTITASYLVLNDERFREVWFRGIHKTFFSVDTRPSNAFSFALEGGAGKFIYRSAAPKMGNGHNVTAKLDIKPTAKLSGSISYSSARLTDIHNNELFFNGYILRSVLIYQFSPEAFFRAILQYNSFADVFDLYPLFSYKLNAFTTFYAGMTNNYFNFEGDTGFSTTDRQYFIKLQYLVQK